MRVDKDNFNEQGRQVIQVECASCKARLHPGHGSGYSVHDDDANGGWANVASADDK